jgi:hypothetical protein
MMLARRPKSARAMAMRAATISDLPLRHGPRAVVPDQRVRVFGFTCGIRGPNIFVRWSWRLRLLPSLNLGARLDVSVLGRP